MKIGLQLFSVRDSYSNKEEFKDALSKIKIMGYDGVEFAGYSGIDASELACFLKEIDLEPIASHHDISEFEFNLEEIIDFDSKVGCRYVVCSYSPTSDLEEVMHLQTILEKAKEAVKAYSIELAYHNHSNEFISLEDGSIPIDHIKKCCKLELDTYWVFNTGLEPCHYILEIADRLALIHIKDGDLDGRPCTIGEGFNNVNGIIKTSKQIGVEWIINENDNPFPNGLSDAERSIINLKKL